MINKFLKCAVIIFGIISVCLSCKDNDGNEYNRKSYMTAVYSNYSDSVDYRLILTYDGEVIKNKEVSVLAYDENKKLKLTFADIIAGEKETTVSDIDLVSGEFEGVYTTKSSKKIKYSGYIAASWDNKGILSLSLDSM